MAEHGLRLLCLDGGGIRGLASLYILKALLSKVGNPKPCDYFDMICGTSTGG
jgi:patatin-like phospholipase/acyl hydrolase